MKVIVNREHGNTGDVLVSLDGGEPFHVPGDVTSFTALRMLGPWLEEEFGKNDLVASFEAYVAENAALKKLLEEQGAELERLLEVEKSANVSRGIEAEKARMQQMGMQQAQQQAQAQYAEDMAKRGSAQ